MRLPLLLLVVVLAGCGDTHPASDALQPIRPTQPVAFDSDDPAIWVHPDDPSLSLILGTDKIDMVGGLYAFDLAGTERTDLRVDSLDRPNNVAIALAVPVGSDTLDLAVVTERGKGQLRVFRMPDLAPVDGGGIPVFVDQPAFREPMGVAVYQPEGRDETFVIVSRKAAPAGQGYLYQYRLEADTLRSVVQATFVRAFGAFEGSTEIEAIAVDNQLGYVYYSDEGFGIRKYHAHPERGDAELAVFGREEFTEDREGIALYPTSDSTGFLIVSDQQAGAIHVYPREGAGGSPHDHPKFAHIPYMARETDGLEVTHHALGAEFPEGLLVAMSEDRTFHFYDWRGVRARIPVPGGLTEGGS